MRWIAFILILLIAGCAAAQVYAPPDTVNTGSGPDVGDGDPGRTAFSKLNTNDKAVYDSLQDLRSKGDQNATAISNKIALDEPERIQYTDLEDGLSPTDTVVVKVNGLVRKITKGDLTYDLAVSIADLQEQITEMEDTINAQSAYISALELTSIFDTIWVDDQVTTVYVLYTHPDYGQLQIAWALGEPQDYSIPYVISAEVGNYSDSVIVLTMSEQILGDSINEYSGTASQNWDRVDYWWKMELTSSVVASIGSNTITGTGAASISGVDGNAWDMENGGGDYGTLATSLNIGAQDICVGAWVYITDESYNRILIGGLTDAFCFGINASEELQIQKYGIDYAESTSLSVPVGQWTYIGMWYDQVANLVYFFNDGTVEAVAFNDQFTVNTTSVGGRGSRESMGWQGRFDELHVAIDEQWAESRFDSLWNSGTFIDYNEMGGSATINTDTITNAFISSKSPLLPGYGVDDVWASGNKIYLDLTDVIQYSDNVTWRYNQPTGSGSNLGVRDTSDNYMLSVLVNQNVVNNIDTAVANDYTILEEWNFESESLGAFGETELEALFGDYRIPNTSYITSPQIVSRTINGVARNVLQITNDEGLPDPITQYYGGLSHQWDLGSTYEEVNVSFLFMVDTDVTWTPDIKLHGFNVGWVSIGGPPLYSHGFRAWGYLKYGGKFNSYFYMHNYEWGAWDKGTSDIDTIYIVPGVWYNMTLRARLNDAGSENGLFEAGLDGIWKNQVTGLEYIEDPAMTIDGIGLKEWTGGNGAANQSDRDWSTYVANVVVWTPLNDNIFGSEALHNPAVAFDHPYPVTDKDFYYESIISTESTLTNDDWGSPYGSSVNEYHLLDAGPGDQVRITFNSGSAIGSNDFLFLYDGEYAGSNLLGKYTGTGITTGTVIESTGRYLYLYFTSANYDGYGAGWSIDITHF